MTISTIDHRCVLSNDGSVGVVKYVEPGPSGHSSQVVCSDDDDDDDGKGGGEEVGVEMEYSSSAMNDNDNSQSCDDRRLPTTTTTTTTSSIVDSTAYATSSSLHQRGGEILRSIICRASTKKLVSVVTRRSRNKQRTRNAPNVVVRCEEEEEVHDQITTPSFTMDYNNQEEEEEEEEDGRDEEVEIGQEVDHQQSSQHQHYQLSPNNNNNNNNNNEVSHEEEENMVLVVIPPSDASIISSSIVTTTPNNNQNYDPLQLSKVRSPSTLTNVSGFSGTTRALLRASSSITTSTCDFTNEINHHAMFESYLSSDNPWDAARRGDYAALKYISKFDDQAVWTMEDEEQKVPLYYACTSYSLQNNDGIYDQQQQQPPSSKLESVRLLVQTWPTERDFPKYLMDELPSIHADIRAILTRAEKKRRDVNNGGVVTRYQQQQLSSSPLHLMKSKSTINFPPTINERLRSVSTPEAAVAVGAESETVGVASLIIDDVDQVVPISFLEDLGDDGYVEDY